MRCVDMKVDMISLINRGSDIAFKRRISRG